MAWNVYRANINTLIFPGLSHHYLPSSSISIGKQLQLKYDMNQKSIILNTTVLLFIQFMNYSSPC